MYEYDTRFLFFWRCIFTVTPPPTLFRRYGNSDGTIPATFQVIHLLGWKPDPSQAKPAPRGSATHSLADISGTVGSVGDITARIEAARQEVKRKGGGHDQ